MVGPRMTWVGHASYVLEQGGTSLLVDPWLVGTAFDDGWAQHSPPQLSAETLRRVTHIWVSHEHPDHFSPATLRLIAATVNRTITFLYSSESDGRVIDEWRSVDNGPVQTLEPGEWSQLDGGLEVMCTPHRFGDSYLAARTTAGIVLNLNDCVVSTDREARSIAVPLRERPFALLTQFSHATNVGRQSDSTQRRAAEERALECVRVQAAALQPRYIIPFASFVWFCHDENRHMNNTLNRTSDVVRLITDSTAAQPVVMYPGDSWALSEPPLSPTVATKRYDADLAKAVATTRRIQSPRTELWALHASGRRFARDLRSANGRLVLQMLRLVGYVRAVTVQLTDHRTLVTVSPSGVKVAGKRCGKPTAAMSSTALLHLLEHRYGGSTLLSNGRYERQQQDHRDAFNRLIRLRDANNVGRGIGSVMWSRLVPHLERFAPPGGRLARWVRLHRAGPIRGRRQTHRCHVIGT